MPLFGKNAYNYTKEPLPIPKNIPKRKPEQASSLIQPNIIVPSFVISLSQTIITFILNKSSRFPLIGTKNGKPNTFTIDEFHILILSLLCFSIHYTHKYRKRSKQLTQKLHKLLTDSKIHNFQTLAACDGNNIKRIESLYYKYQFQIYDIDLLSRTELRTYTQTLMSQCEVLSGLTLKILESINTMFKHSQIAKLRQKYSKKGRKSKQLISKQSAIEKYYDGEEERVDKYQSFFDEKNNELYLREILDSERQKTEKEILESYQSQSEQKKSDIESVKKIDLGNFECDQKMTEESDKCHWTEERQLQIKYDNDYLRRQAESLPIQQIDFGSAEISEYNLEKEVNAMRYNIILNEGMERSKEKLRKYAIMTCIVGGTVFAYWYNRHYEGKSVAQKIRDGKARFFALF